MTKVSKRSLDTSCFFFSRDETNFLLLRLQKKHTHERLSPSSIGFESRTSFLLGRVAELLLGTASCDQVKCSFFFLFRESCDFSKILFSLLFLGDAMILIT